MSSKIVIHVSFKENVKDLELYNWLINKSSKSGFIKDVLRAEMKKELKNNKPTIN